MRPVRFCIILVVLAGLSIAAMGQGREQSKQAQQMGVGRDNLFLKHLSSAFVVPDDAAGQLLLREYGAMLVAGKGVGRPPRVFFRDEDDVLAFQAALERAVVVLGGYRIELQAAAMEELREAIVEAAKSGLTISPRGADSARRGYDQTVSLWASRVNPGMVHWVSKGKISKQDADRIRSLKPFEQIPEILALERRQIFFARDLSKSIIYSVAPPGSSQHISMLALDVKEFDDARVRAILAKHGWFQTVVSDLPHFTFLGHDEGKLPGLGLKLVVNSGRRFWIPDLPEAGGSIQR